MVRVRVGMHQADADGAQPLLPHRAGGFSNGAFVEGLQFRALEVQPSGDLANMMQRDEAVRFHPEIGVAIAIGHRLAGDLEDVAEPFGDNQPKAFNLALEKCVGRDGRAMADNPDIGRIAPGNVEHIMYALDQAHGRVGRGARHFCDVHNACGRID